ncbi:Site-specific recombinase XerD [Neorhodopirellula lusitana]|uniref:Site-specific recombinase XerD n=1 Tax=Neorhodopirellula lusitana TaxID=445327 RepID=A0ABY1QQ33_9BACT|nr:site-specific integrase [Neorhodopirellula lusitana]SMP77076.1 Site-specific recombinase XerD [Neorhodopirellula lusitana]
MRQPKPFYRKSKQAWYVQVGKRQVSLGKDEKQAWKRYHQVMAENEPIKDNTTIETLFERYLDWVQEHRKPGTYTKVRYLLSRFARFIGKKAKVAKLSGADLSRWVESESTWNSTTRSDGIKAVLRCFNWAVGKQYLVANHVASVPEKPSRKRREVVYSDTEWQELRGYVNDTAFGDLLDFMWETGCRPLEARMLESRHVDLKAGVAIFPPSEAKGGKHERVIYLTDTAAEICQRRVERYPSGPIMRNKTGRPWTKDAIGCRFQRLTRKLGRRACAYAIRHSFATQGLINGLDSLTLSQLMGHSDVSTLAKNYAHLAKNPSYLREQARKLRKT